MKTIEECNEKLDLLEKALAVEEKQRKRRSDLALQSQREQDESSRQQLQEMNPTTQSLFEHEEMQRKNLMNSLIHNSSSSDGPVVKVLSNIQGQYIAIKMTSVQPLIYQSHLRRHGKNAQKSWKY